MYFSSHMWVILETALTQLSHLHVQLKTFCTWFEYNICALFKLFICLVLPFTVPSLAFNFFFILCIIMHPYHLNQYTMPRITLKLWITNWGRTNTNLYKVAKVYAIFCLSKVGFKWGYIFNSDKVNRKLRWGLERYMLTSPLQHIMWHART